MTRYHSRLFVFIVLSLLICAALLVPNGVMAAVSAEDMAEIRAALAADIAQTQHNLDHVWTMVAAALEAAAEHA